MKVRGYELEIGADLAGADLTDADLRSVDLSESWLGGAVLSGRAPGRPGPTPALNSVRRSTGGAHEEPTGVVHAGSVIAPVQK